MTTTSVLHLSPRCYTALVPTKRPRHLVTETEELAKALDESSARWPDLSRAQLLARLALVGYEATLTADADRRSRRLRALRQHGGELTGVYGPDYLRQLREDWPE